MLTNLQRGNVQHQQTTNLVERTWHELAAQGELLEVHLSMSHLSWVKTEWYNIYLDFPLADDPSAKEAIDELDEKGFSPLLWAAHYGQLATVRLLIQHGANPTLRGHNGETALLFAASNGQVHVVKELLQRHSNVVDVNETDHVRYLFDFDKSNK